MQVSALLLGAWICLSATSTVSAPNSAPLGEDPKTAKNKKVAAKVVPRNKIPRRHDDYPLVFTIQEEQVIFEQLTALYPVSLLDVCEYDMDVAFDKWTGMMHALELHADKNNFNIKGVKMWIKVFWAADGSVEHIAYSLKPQSRNVKIAELNAVIKTFMEKYKFPQTGATKFSNYASVSFPMFMKPSNP